MSKELYKAVEKGEDAESALDRIRKGIGKCLASVPSWIDRLVGTVSVSAACGDIIKTITSKDGTMLGKNGVKIESKSVGSGISQKIGGKEKQLRIDVENVNPLGGIPASIHIQGSGENFKYYFNPQNGKLYSKSGIEFVEESNGIQKILENQDIQKSINKALTLVSEEAFFKIK